MNNQTPGSAEHSLAQSALRFPDQPTVRLKVAQFRAMIPAELRGEGTELPREMALSATLREKISLDVLPEIVEATRQRLAEHARENRVQRRGAPQQAKTTQQLYSSHETGQEAPVPRPVLPETTEGWGEALRASYELPQPQVRVVKEQGRQPTAQPLPEFPPLVDLLDVEALRPTRGRGAGGEGAGAFAALLDSLARYVVTVCPGRYLHAGGPLRQVVLHLSSEMLAATLGCNEATAWRWTQQLEQLGYLQARPHYSNRTNKDGKRVTAIDGTLYAIRLAVGHQAYLSYEDLTRSYRDLDADRDAGRTAHRAITAAKELKNKSTVLDDENKMQGSTNISITTKYLRQQLQTWAVTPGQVKPPLIHDPCIFDPDELDEAIETVQDVIYLLPTVAEAHPKKRAALVGILGAALARALDDQHSRAWYCKTIWKAWAAGIEGRAGLQILAAQLARLDVDRREWSELKRPAALLAKRLKSA
jgi:hypothetical protein